MVLGITYIIDDSKEAFASLPDRFVIIEEAGMEIPYEKALDYNPKVYIVKDRVLGAYYIYTVSYCRRGDSGSISTTMQPLIDVNGLPKVDKK